MPGLGQIDTHQHVVPPEYCDWLADHDITAGGLPLPEWSVQVRAGIHGQPRHQHRHPVGVHTRGAARRQRRGPYLGTKGQRVRRRRGPRASGSFGLFATLTLPDVDGALAEAAYAFDELDADGVLLLTNVAGTYLGDPSFEPLFAELSRRGAVVFVHPAELPAPAVPGIPPFAVDFLLDTTRAALSLIVSGTLRRHPRLKVILSHAGGFLPYAADRVSAIAPLAPALTSAAELLREFYFDVALSSGPSALPSLLGFTDPARITYGSDYPTPQPRSPPASATSTSGTRSMPTCAGLSTGATPRHCSLGSPASNPKFYFPKIQQRNRYDACACFCPTRTNS